MSVGLLIFAISPTEQLRDVLKALDPTPVNDAFLGITLLVFAYGLYSALKRLPGY